MSLTTVPFPVPIFGLEISLRVVGEVGNFWEGCGLDRPVPHPRFGDEPPLPPPTPLRILLYLPLDEWFGPPSGRLDQWSDYQLSKYAKSWAVGRYLIPPIVGYHLPSHLSYRIHPKSPPQVSR